MVVVPTGKSEPELGVATTVGAEQLSVASGTVKLTAILVAVAVEFAGKVTTTLAGAVSLGGVLSTTVTIA
jgi:hypothetical protein